MVAGVSAFGGLSFSQLVDLQVNAVGRDRDIILVALQDFVNELPNLRYKSRKPYYSDVRSAFMHNRAELPQDRSFRLRADVEPVERRMTVNDFRKVLATCDRKYRTVFLMMWFGLMGFKKKGAPHLHFFIWLRKAR